MKRKIISMLDSTKKKVDAAVLCGALVTAIGTGTAFAANARTSLQVKMVNGVKSYSTDGGETWSEKSPNGVIEAMSKDEKFTIRNGNPTEDGLTI